VIETLRERLGGRDPSEALALVALIAEADAQGSLAFADLAVAYRQAYLEAQRREFGEATRQRGALSVDEVRRHLRTSVLPRLVNDDLLEPLPETYDDDHAVQLVPSVARGLLQQRDASRAAVLDLALEAIRTAEVVAERAAPAGSTLRADGLVKAYRRRRVVDGVEIQVQQGEIVGLLGPNGAGKTTTFYMMVGLVRPEAGRIWLDDDDISTLPMYRRAQLGIGYLAQEPSIFRKLTVEQNVLAILETLPLSNEERHARLETLLDDLSIKHLREVRAYKLSGGERRRLEITRALVTEPKFLLLDEPFTGVDPIAVADIQTIVAGLRQRGIGVLITDHNVEQTLDIVDRAYIIFEGRVQVSGTVRELVFNDQVADLYLGPTLTTRLRERLGAMA
jgi:lipopolysaccharide export system ATP-binding protein